MVSLISLAEIVVPLALALFVLFRWPPTSWSHFRWGIL